MQTLAQIRELLDLAGHGPKKALGQNFLIDRNLVAKLIDSSGVGPGDLALEIGPGTGTLTQGMLERGVRVIACELDTDLSRVLRETLGQRFPDTFTLIEGDCLDGKRAMNPEVTRLLADRPFRLVANLPYHAATPLMLILMSRHPACSGMFVTIQQEVVDRLAAHPGTKEFGAISVLAQALGKVERIAKLPPECFWPRPEVTSAMMSWRRDPGVPIDPEWWVAMGETVQTLFQSRRKQMGKAVRQLAGGEIAWPEGVQPSDRVEGLSVAQIEALARAIHTPQA
jgi:16S rRNA (adenine1518-N6/adenine1519-N6)-dimethyltransferase